MTSYSAAAGVAARNRSSRHERGVSSVKLSIPKSRLNVLAGCGDSPAYTTATNSRLAGCGSHRPSPHANRRSSRCARGAAGPRRRKLALGEPRQLRSQRVGQLGDHLGERVLGHHRVGLELAVKVLLGDEKTGPPDEIAEDIPRFGPERDRMLAPPQPVAGGVQPVGIERDRPAGSRARRCAHRLLGRAKKSENFQAIVTTPTAMKCKASRAWH